MDTEQLRTALALMQHETVNRTAAAQGLAPSSVSDRVRRLEHRLGSRLFTRDHSGMHPTAAGRAYLAAAREALAALDSAAERLTDSAGVVVVGAQSSIADTLLPAVLDDLDRRLPDLVAQIRPESDRRRLLARLDRGEVDAAVLLDTGPALGDLGYGTPRSSMRHLDLREVPMVTVASPDSTLLGRPLAVSDLSRVGSLVGQESRCSFWLATRRWLGPDVDLTAVGGLAQVRDWVAAGRGIAVLPEFVVNDDLEAGRLAVLDVSTPPLSLRLVWCEARGEDYGVRQLLYALSLV